MAENLQLGIKITADAAGAKASIASTAEEMQKLARASTYATRKAAEEAKRMASSWAELGKMGQSQMTAIKTAQRLAQGMSEAGQAAQKAARQAATGAGLMSQSFDNLSGSAKLAGTAIAGMVAAFSVRAVVDAAREMDRMRGMLEAASGNALLSAQNLKFVDQTARTLGINLISAAEGFANITAAARGTALQGKATNDIFVAVAKASAALGKSSSDTLSMIQALGQMISKGTVSMEELRGQLGDRLPGAFQIAARAMGMTTQELDKLISSGQVTAVEFLPKLAQALEETYGNARFDRLNNNIERLNNSWTKFKANVVDSDNMSRSITVVSGLLEKLNGLVEKSKALGGDPFQIIPNVSQVQKAVAGQTTSNPLQPIDTETLTKSTGAASKTAQQYIAAANAAWKLSAAQQKVVETIVKIGDSKGFDPAFLLSIARAETRLGELNRVSSAGAKGVFQFMDGTARRFGVRDPWNLEQATNGAILYLGKLKTQFKSVGLAAAGYNAGEGNVQKYGGVPPFKETQTYVRRVLQNMQDLQRAMGGTSDEVGKEIKQAEKDQYESYVDHLRSRESAFSDYSKRAMAEQRTMMERLQAAQQQAEQQAQAAMAGGDVGAIRAAEDQQRKFLEDKKALLLQGIALEEEATRKKIGNIGMEIAQAQKLNQYEGVDKLKQQRSSELAELAALAERRKQIEIGAQADISQAAQKFDDQRRQAQKQAADDNAQLVADQRQATEDAYRQMQQIMDLRMSEATNLAEARKQDIDGQLESARAETAAAQARRQASLDGLTGLQAQQAARDVLNANLRDTLDLIDLEKAKTLEKLVIDGNVLASQRQLLEVYREIANQQGNRDQALAIEKQLQDIYAGQAKNIRDRVAAQTKAAAEAAKAQTDAGKQTRGLEDQSVKEEQLRMNAWWDQYMGRLRDYASLWEQITGNTADGWSQMTLALGEYQKQFNQIQQYWASDAGKAWGDLGPMVEVTQQAQAALAGMAKTLLAMRNQYEEGSQGYKDMTSAAERMMEVQRVAAVVEGVMGVLHQLGSGDPYTAPARAAMAGAIVAAQLASIGMSSAAVPGFSNRQARQMTQAGGSASAGGGVFGDASAQSDSIAKSLEIVSANSSADLAYSAGMLRSLKNIELSLGGTTNAIIRGVGPAAVSGLGTRSLDQMINPLNGISDPLTKALHKLVFNVSTKITDWGIKGLPQSLDQVIAKGFAGMNWTEVTKTTKVFGITIGKSVKNFYTALDIGVAGQITRVIRSMADTVREAGKAFGISGEQFMSAMKGFTVNFGTLSTKGLKGDELEKAVQQVFSSMSDDMAQAFQSRFNLGLEEFMVAGEGMFQTLVRISDGINVATGMLAQAGLQAINYQEIVYKQGDIAAEIVRQSIVAFEGVNSAIGAYVDQAVGSAEELMSVYQDLLIISDTAKLTGFNLNNLSNALIVTSGGVSKFLANLQTYQTEILGSSDYARQMLTLTREFQKLGQAVPANNEAFVKLVDSIDTTTESGQKLYAQILSLAGAFSKAQQEAAKLEELRAKYTPKDSMAEYRKQIDQVGIDFKQIIEGTLAGLPGGPNYIKRTQRIESLTNLKEYRQDELALVNEDIQKLEAKGKLTAKEKQTLAGLRQQRKDLESEIKDTDSLIAKINKLIAANKNTKGLIEERNKLIEEQGNAIIQTIADIWDKMTQAINAAKETLIGIQNDIFELNFTVGSPDVKLGMATAKKVTAETAYYGYTGNNIEELNKYASALHQAIMAEYQAKMDAIMAPKIALEKERDLAQKAHDEQIAALEKQLGVAKELFDAVKNIQEYAKSLRTSAAANLSPRKQMEAAKKNYDELLAKAQGGDVEAMRQITGASDAYLEAARKYFGSGGKYGQIFDGIVSAMDSLGMTDAGDAQSIQDKIDELNRQHGIYLDGIETKIGALGIDEKVKALQLSTASELDKLAKNLGPRIEAAELQAKKDMTDLIGKVTETNGWSEKQLAALNQMLTAWGMNPIAGPAPAKPPEPALPAPTDDWVQRLFEQWNKTQTGYKAPLPAFASGGIAQPGWALVGEEGPELVKFGSQAQIFAADATQRMLREIASFQPVPSQAPRPINLEKMPRVIDDIRRPDRNPAKLSGNQDDVVAELKAMRAELKALVTTQSRANPAVIEQLANIERRLGYMERDAKLKPA